MSSLRKLSIESLHHQYDIPKSIHLQYCTDESTFPQPSEKQFQICVTLGQIHSGLCLPISKNPLLFDYLIFLQRSPGQFNGNFYRIFHALHHMNLDHQGRRDALKREKLEKNQPYTKEDDSQYPVWTCQDVLDYFDLQSVPSSQNLFWCLRKKTKVLIKLPTKIVTDNADKDWRKFPLLISGNWYDGTDAIPSEGRQIECLWRVHKEGDKASSFYNFSLLSSAMVPKRKDSYSDAMVSKRRKDAHPSEPKGVPPDPFGVGTPLNISVRGDNDVDAPTDGEIHVLDGVEDVPPDPFGDGTPLNTSVRGDNDVDAPTDGEVHVLDGVEDVPPDPFGDGTPLNTSVRGDNDVDAPTDGEVHVLDGLHDHDVSHALYLVNAAFQDNASCVKKLHAELNKVKKDREVLNEEVAKLRSLVSIKDTYQSNDSCMENLNNNGDGGNAEQTSRVRSLELAVSRLQSENDAYKSSVTSLQNDIDRFSQQNALLQEDVTKSTNAYALLMKEKDALHSSRDEELYALLDSYETLLKEKDALQRVYDGLVDSSTEDNMHLISTNHSLMSTNADLECKIQSLTNQCSSLQQELVQLKSGFERDKLAMESKHKREMDDTSECYAKRIQANEVAHVHALNKQWTELETDCRRLVREGAQHTLDNIISLSKQRLQKGECKGNAEDPQELKSFAEKLKNKGNAEDPPEG